jgi:hypothetical protein
VVRVFLRIPLLVFGSVVPASERETARYRIDLALARGISAVDRSFRAVAVQHRNDI